MLRRRLQRRSRLQLIIANHRSTREGYRLTFHPNPLSLGSASLSSPWKE